MAIRCAQERSLMPAASSVTVQPVYEQDGGVDVASPLAYGISEASFCHAVTKGLRIFLHAQPCQDRGTGALLLSPQESFAYRKEASCLCSHDVPREIANIPRISDPGSTMSPSRVGLCGWANPTRDVLTEHELAQQTLYLIWRSGRLTCPLYVQMWADSLGRLQLEGECSFFDWLVQRHPELCNE